MVIPPFPLTHPAKLASWYVARIQKGTWKSLWEAGLQRRKRNSADTTTRRYTVLLSCCQASPEKLWNRLINKYLNIQKLYTKQYLVVGKWAIETYVRAGTLVNKEQEKNLEVIFQRLEKLEKGWPSMYPNYQNSIKPPCPHGSASWGSTWPSVEL